MLRPSGETAGGVRTAPSLPFQISVDWPFSKRHTPLAVAERRQIERRRCDAPRRALESAVGSGNGFMSESSAARSARIGTVHKLAFGFATVATSLRPSGVAAIDAYFSTPKLTRRDVCDRRQPPRATGRSHRRHGSRREPSVDRSGRHDRRRCCDASAFGRTAVRRDPPDIHFFGVRRAAHKVNPAAVDATRPESGYARRLSEKSGAHLRRWHRRCTSSRRRPGGGRPPVCRRETRTP